MEPISPTTTMTESLSTPAPGYIVAASPKSLLVEDFTEGSMRTT